MVPFLELMKADDASGTLPPMAKNTIPITTSGILNVFPETRVSYVRINDYLNTNVP